MTGFVEKVMFMPRPKDEQEFAGEGWGGLIQAGRWHVGGP